MALIIVLSVFNGFEKLVISLFNVFNPDLIVQVSEGKTFSSTLVPAGKIRQIPGVLFVSEVIEENALLRYRDKQYIVTIKGVEKEYGTMSGLDTMMVEGTFLLEDEDKDFAVLGSGVAYYVGANTEDYLNPVSIYVPQRAGNFSGMFESAFQTEVVFPSGVFSVQQDFDTKYIILPLRFVKKLLDYKDEITAVEVIVSKNADIPKIRSQLKDLYGPGFTIKNRFEQQELLYKVMKSEKWAIFLILAFILFIATFNVIGSLSMLILDKRQDIALIQCLGGGQAMIKKIFRNAGLLITMAGALTGLFLGAIVCLIQQLFKVVKLGSAESTFVVDAYPVSMQPLDFLFIFVTVMLIGYSATWFSVFNLRKVNLSLLFRRF